MASDSDSLDIVALEAFSERLTLCDGSDAGSAPETSRRGWWSAAPTTHGTLSSRPPPSPLALSPVAPQPLWPHHLLPGETSPLPTPPTVDPSPGAARAAAAGRSALPLRPLYAGVFLAGPSRHLLLMRCPPRHATVYAHHVTLRYFGYDFLTPEDISKNVAACAVLPLGTRAAMGVDGIAADDRVQALKITLPGWLLAYTDGSGGGGRGGGKGGPKKQRKKDRSLENTGSLLHVTVSSAEGVPASESGQLLAGVEGGPDPIHGLRVLHGVVGVCLSDRSVVYSLKELEDAVYGGAEEGEVAGADSGSSSWQQGLTSTVLGQKTSDITQTASLRERSSNSSTGGGIVDLVSVMRAVLLPAPPGQQAESGGGASAVVIGTQDELSRVEDAGAALEAGAGAAAPHPPPGAMSFGEKRRRVRVVRGKRRTKEPDPPAATPASETDIAAAGPSLFPTPPVPAAPSLPLSPSTPIDLVSAEAERASMETHRESYNAARAASETSRAAGRSWEAAAHAAAAKRAAAAAIASRRRASTAAFIEHNASHLNTFRLDLHGLHVSDSLAILRRYLDGLEAIDHPGGVLLHIVTGFGRHSEGGRARVLPAVVGLLSNTKHLFDMEEDNPGAIRVLIGGVSDV